MPTLPFSNTCQPTKSPLPLTVQTPVGFVALIPIEPTPVLSNFIKVAKSDELICNLVVGLVVPMPTLPVFDITILYSPPCIAK